MNNIKFTFKKNVEKIFYTLIISYALQMIVGILLGYFGFGLSGIFTIIIQVTTIFLPFVVLGAKYNALKKDFDTMGYYDCTEKKCSVSVQFKLLLTGLAFGIAASLFAAIIQIISQSMNIKLSTLEIDPNKNLIELLISIVSYSVAPALIEEFAFRGVIMGMLKKYNAMASIVISSIMFGLFHANIPQFIFASLLGLYLGFIRIKTDSLRLPIILHFSMNSFSIFMGSMVKNIDQMISVPIYLLTILFIISLGVLSFLSLKKSGEISLKDLSNNSSVSDVECYRLSIFNLGFLFFMIVSSLLFAVTVKTI